MSKELLEALQEVGQMQKESKEKYEEEVNEYWNSLDYEDQLKAFYAVCQRIYKGDVIDKGSYRYVLYDVFDFGPEAYALGMDCGYMYLHNAIDAGPND